MLFLAPALPVFLLLGSVVGWAVRSRVHERHRAPAAVESLRLVMSMMVTFAALVLGLLTSSAKSDFDAQGRSLQAFGISLIEVNQRLREYGPDAAEARALLRRYTAAAIADTWPDEPAPPGDYPRGAGAGTGRDRRMESAALGDLLLDVDKRIGALQPVTPLQRQVAPLLERTMSSVLERRWQLVAAGTPSVAWPFLAVLLLWLMLVFFLFGLSTPPSRLTALVILLAATSVAAAVYLILDYDTPLSGPLRLSSETLRDALAHMDRVTPAGG